MEIKTLEEAIELEKNGYKLKGTPSPKKESIGDPHMSVTYVKGDSEINCEVYCHDAKALNNHYNFKIYPQPAD